MTSREDHPLPAANSEDARSQTEERLSALVSDYGLDPSIAAAYTPDATALYVYPGMAPAFGQELTGLQVDSVQRLHALCVDAYAQGFTNPKVEQGVARLRRELDAHGSADDARITAALVKRTGTEGSAAVALATGNVGLMRSDLHNAVVQATYLHYFFEMGSVNLSLDDAGDVFTYFKDLAFGSEVPSDDLSLRDVAIRLRRMGVVDLSRVHLEARLAHHTAVVQAEAAVILLSGLQTFTRLKPSDGPQRAAAIAERYADALMGHDIEGKVELARRVADLYGQYRRQLRDRRSRLILEVYARDAAAVAETLPAASGMLGLVYEDLGFELPPQLQYLAEQDESEVDRPAAADRAAGRLAIRRELQTQLEELTVQAEAFSRGWRLSARERRQRGLDGMQRALVVGFTDTSGQPILDAVPKTRARQVIDVVARLDGLIHDGPDSEAAARLDAALTEEQALRGRVAELQTASRTVGVRMEPLAVEPVREVITLLQANWPGYRQLIIEIWPGQQGMAVVRRLEKLVLSEVQ